MPVTPLAPDTSAPVARWQRELAAAIRSPEALCAALDLDPATATAAHAAGDTFPLLVPRGFVPRMRKGDPRDPLLLVATDRVSAFDVVMDEPIPYKGAVLTQISAWWFRHCG